MLRSVKFAATPQGHGNLVLSHLSLEDVDGVGDIGNQTHNESAPKDDRDVSVAQIETRHPGSILKLHLPGVYQMGDV